MAENTAIIIRDKELIEKVDKLKKLFNYKTRTKYIESLVNEKYELFFKHPLIINGKEFNKNLTHTKTPIVIDIK